MFIMAKKIILFGDSLLAGYTDGHSTNRVTNALKNKLTEYEIINTSIPGLTTEEADDFLDKKILTHKYDLVVLGLGTNDDSVYNGLNAGRYAYNLDKLVKKLNPNKVILMGPSYTNWKVDHNQSWPRTLQFNLIAEHCSIAHHLPFLNLNKEMMETNKPNSLLQKDGVHLNQSGIELLTTKLSYLIKQKIVE